MNKLESETEAYIDINDMIRCANEFYTISQNEKTFISNFAILAFACELYMKTILFYHTKKFPKEHDLWCLYIEISKHFNKSEFIEIFAEQMRKLFDDFNMESSEQSLIETLHKNRNMFEDWRYLFEKKIDKPYIVHGFVFELAESLKLYVDKFIKKEAQMKIELKQITIGEVVKGYQDNLEAGVVGYDGKLDIRPPYQREFVYNGEQRDEVIRTIRKGFPLNVMYYVVRDDGTFEVMDGQQRTISFCQYVNGDFSVKSEETPFYFHNLTTDEQKQILDYELQVYFCTGTDKEKLEWFKIINIAGEKLTAQELRNAVYTGSWLADAKLKFSKSNAPAKGLAEKYINGSPIRQEYLETALKWLSDGDIEDYMSKHQHDQNANELWLYFRAVIEWVENTFVKYRKEMKGVDWGKLYNLHGKDNLNTEELETRISKLMQDEDVTNKKGIYDYVLTGNERSLSIRTFNDREKREAYENQKGICPACGQSFEIEEMEADHIMPWSKGGKTIAENCQMLCKDCNRRKSGV